VSEATDNLVPGVMRCAKCDFQLHRSNLNMHAGTVTAGDSKTEPCPNGCGPLWPVTWKQNAEEGWSVAEKYFDEIESLTAKNDALVEALEGLVDATHGMGGDFDQVMMDAINNANETLANHRGEG